MQRFSLSDGRYIVAKRYMLRYESNLNISGPFLPYDLYLVPQKTSIGNPRMPRQGEGEHVE